MTRIIPPKLIEHLEWNPGQEVPVVPTVGQGTQLVQGREFSIEQLINQGKPFYSDAKDSSNNWIGVTVSLEETQNHVGEEGVIASMPYLLAGKAKADKDNYLWKTWLTALSEENVGIDKNGKFVSTGHPVVVTVHGGGILTLDRIKRAYSEGLTPKNAAKLEDEEFDNLLEGTLPSGERIELYSIADVANGNVTNPFGRYGIVTDFEVAKSTTSGYHEKTNFMVNPLVHARAGTLEYLDEYFEKAKRDLDDKLRNSHPFNSIDPAQPQGRVLFLSYFSSGLGGGNDLYNDGRFVGVAPEAPDAR